MRILLPFNSRDGYVDPMREWDWEADLDTKRESIDLDFAKNIRNLLVDKIPQIANVRVVLQRPANIQAPWRKYHLERFGG
jgi:hypothetical protein